MNQLEIVGYARVSSKEQSENSYALEQQILRLRRAGATKIISDVETGSSSKRPGFNHLLSLVRQNAIAEVVVTRLDRLTRRLKTTLDIREIFINSSCNLRALDDRIDISTPVGKFHLSLLGSLAEMEVDRLGERIRHGQAAMRKDGRIGYAPFGYRCNDRGKLIYDTTNAISELESRKTFTYYDLAIETIDLFFNKGSVSGCVREFNRRFGIVRLGNTRRGGHDPWMKIGWSVSGLRYWLNNPALRGHTYYTSTKETLYNTHEPLLGVTEFEELARIIKLNRSIEGRGRRVSSKFTTTGLVICQHCQRPAHHFTSTNKVKGVKYQYNYVQCKSVRLGLCRANKMITAESIEQAAIAKLIERASALAHVTIDKVGQSPVSGEELKLREQLSGLEKLGYNRAIEQTKQEIKKQIEALKQTKADRDTQKQHSIDLLISVFSERDFWANQPIKTKQRILKQLVDRIYIDNGVVTEVILSI